MWRCELIITGRCNFRCTYCRGPRPEASQDMPLEQATQILNYWMEHGLRNVRFSGGEPTVHPHLSDLVGYCQGRGVQRIAISTNGSAPAEMYGWLVDAGANDFSVSLDACCASDANGMAGAKINFDRLVENIRYLASRTYVTVGVVVTGDNVGRLVDVVQFAHDLGVADIRIISAAQYNQLLTEALKIPDAILNAHPILRYRVANMVTGRNVRGLEPADPRRCHLAVDDSVIGGGYHYPCVIHMREGGAPIGKVGPNMRAERVAWSESYDTYQDPICRKNCLDVCIDYNARFEALRP